MTIPDIQVTGSGGMLGRQVLREATRRGWKVVDSPVDITCITAGDIQCSVVVNCAAITDRKVPQCKTVSVNSLGPHVLAGACDRVGARLVHVSTDMVFSGPGPHKESDIPDAITFPALAKLFGEVKHGRHATIRTSIIGTGRRGLIRDVLEATAATPLIASDKLLWSGITAVLCAQLLLDIAVRADIRGILHVPAPATSRWTLCCVIAEWLGVSKASLRQDDSFVADRRLISERWEELGLQPVPSITEQLQKVEKPNGTDQRGDPSGSLASSQEVAARDDGKHRAANSPAT